jgi:hypothetical protein
MFAGGCDHLNKLKINHDRSDCVNRNLTIAAAMSGLGSENYLVRGSDKWLHRD